MIATDLRGAREPITMIAVHRRGGGTIATTTMMITMRSRRDVVEAVARRLWNMAPILYP
jgi:hypothetical protein